MDLILHKTRNWQGVFKKKIILILVQQKNYYGLNMENGLVVPEPAGSKIKQVNPEIKLEKIISELKEWQLLNDGS